MMQLTHFNILDYAIIGIILLSVIVGCFRGFLREAISLITLFLAVVAALKLSPILSPLLKSFISHSMMRYITSMIVIFVVVMILGMIINRFARLLVTTSGMGFFDRLLGFIFGAARGTLFVVILLLIVTESPAKQSHWYQQSQLPPHFQTLISHFDTLIPMEMRAVSAWMNQLSATVQAGVDASKNPDVEIDGHLKKMLNDVKTK